MTHFTLLPFKTSSQSNYHMRWISYSHSWNLIISSINVIYQFFKPNFNPSLTCIDAQNMMTVYTITRHKLCLSQETASAPLICSLKYVIMDMNISNNIDSFFYIIWSMWVLQPVDHRLNHKELVGYLVAPYAKILPDSTPFFGCHVHIYEHTLLLSNSCKLCVWLRVYTKSPQMKQHTESNTITEYIIHRVWAQRWNVWFKPASFTCTDEVFYGSHVVSDCAWLSGTNII